MNGLFKIIIATSLLTAGIPWALAGPVQNIKRQDGTAATSAPAESGSAPAVSVARSSSTTRTVSTSAVTSAPVTCSAASAATPSFTPFTETVPFPPPAVSVIDSWMSENPDARTRSFTHPVETATPTCNVLKCPLTYSNGAPIYGGSTSLPVFPSPFDENTPTPTATEGDVAPSSIETGASTSADISETPDVESSIVVPTASTTAAEEPDPTDV